MTALIVIGIIVLIIALIMLIPVGADIGYEDGVFSLSAKVLGVLIKLFPKDESKPGKEKSGKKKEKKPKKEKKKKKEEEPEEKQPKKKKFDFTLEEIFELLRKVLKKIGRFGRKWNIDRFLLDLVLTGADPYETARLFGYINASIATLAPMCRDRFNCKDTFVRTDVDFGAEETKIDFGLAFSIRIGAFFALAFGIAFAALGILLKNKKRLKKEAKQNPEIPETAEDKEYN